jgi:acyl-CoA thioesterase-2
MSISISKILSIETIYPGLYKGMPFEIGSYHVFGGHVLGQALFAARQTVEDDRLLHSMHSYFILPGDKTKPLFYHVENVRDGGSFNTRRVRCSQSGKDIFILSASYQKEEKGLSHQTKAPDVVSPDEMVSMDDLKKMVMETQPPEMRKYLNEEWPIDVRISLDDLSLPGIKREPIRKVWMKTKVEEIHDPEFHKCMLAYASDFNLLTTTLMPHGIMLPSKGLMMASLDHAMWFHQPINFNDWLLYEVTSPVAENARGLCFGHIYNTKGTLVASVAQEGLVRYDPDRKRKSQK